MIKNYTETTRILNSGFFLNEQELKRLIDVITEQFEKIDVDSKMKFNYITKNYNGLVVESDSLDYVLRAENIGSSQIVTIDIYAYIELKNDSILISFSNNFSERIIEERSIKYSIKSDNRDWALISSSLIDDRLTKISKSNIVGKLSHRVSLLILSFTLIALTTFFIFSLGLVESKSHDTLVVINNIQKKINQKENIDILKSIIEIEKSKLSPKEDTAIGNIKYIAWIFIPLMLLVLFNNQIKKFLLKYFPTRIFYWGDYVEKYDSMIKRRNIILGFIFITVIISFIINILSNFLWEKIGN